MNTEIDSSIDSTFIFNSHDIINAFKSNHFLMKNLHIIL